MADKSATGKSWFGIAKESFSDFLQDDALTQAAAVAYYTALSFAPLLVLVTLIVGTLLGQSGKERVVTEIENLMGPGASTAVEQVMGAQEGGGNGQGAGQGAGQTDGEQSDQGQASSGETSSQRADFTSLTGIIGLLALIYSASGVFAQLQAAMNTIWDVEAAPGNGLWGWIRKRLLSVGVVFAILFLLLASLAITAIMGIIFSGDGIGWRILNHVVSLVVYVALFGLIFKYLPDVKIPWKPVLIGAAITAVLFTIGKWLIGLYLTRGNVGSDYGGAGSLVVLLVWVYYSAVILFLGAEITQVGAKHSGYRIRPDSHARPERPKQKQTAHGESAGA